MIADGFGVFEIDGVFLAHQLLASGIHVSASERTLVATLVVDGEGTMQLLVVVRISPTAIGIAVPQQSVVLVADDERNAHLRVVLVEFLVDAFVVEVLCLMLTESVERLVVGGNSECRCIPCPSGFGVGDGERLR